jgi:hypothetical protein
VEEQMKQKGVEFSTPSVFFGCCGAKYFAEIVMNKRVADSLTFDTKYRYVFLSEMFEMTHCAMYFSCSSVVTC